MRGIEVAAWGTIGRDIELKTSRAGNPYCQLNVAVAVGKGDDGKDVTQWCKVTCFGDVAEKAARTLAKGARVYFEGSLTIETWQTQDGSQRVTAAVSAWKAERVASIGQNRQRDATKPLGAPVASPRPDGWQAPVDFDDRMPF